MSKRLLLILLPLIFCSFKVYTQANEKCLEVKGSLTYDKKKLDNIEVIILEGGKELEKFNTGSSKSIKFSLQKNKVYSVIMKKIGYLDALFIISTEMPKTVETSNYQFQFEYGMNPEKGEYNIDFIDYPAAYIKYSKTNDEFDISVKYDTQIKKNLKK